MAAPSDTIFALASGGTPSAIAVIRISGPQVRFVSETMLGGLPKPRMAELRRVESAEGLHLDSGIALFFPAPTSATGEDVLELHLHGGRAVVAAVFRALSELGAVRPAEPGEFTKRAFLRGKLDLAQLESLGDLVLAQSEAERRLAISGAAGENSALYAEWREALLEARAMVEADLDFADEGDVPGSVADRAWGIVGRVAGSLRDHLTRASRAATIRDGFDVVIVGAPNAGKSSLINALARRDVAIVADQPGTTRDAIEAVLELAGVRVRLTDTAGLRPAADPVEAIGILRALDRARAADLIIVLEDLSAPQPVEVDSSAERIRVGTKADLVAKLPAGYDHCVSVRQPGSVSAFLDALTHRLTGIAPAAGELLPLNARHISCLQRCLEQLTETLAGEIPIELRAEALRQAGAELGRITGEVGAEEVLGAIFSRFCIGK